MNNSDKLPTCIDYTCFLKQANLKLNISINDARSKYGKYSYKQWNKLLKQQNTNVPVPQQNQTTY